jgi:hypothetical protein
MPKPCQGVGARNVPVGIAVTIDKMPDIVVSAV